MEILIIALAIAVVIGLVLAAVTGGDIRRYPRMRRM